MDILARIEPLKLSDGTRPMIRLSSSARIDAAGYGGEVWWPAITRKPILSMQLFDPSFGAGRTGGASLEINVGTLLKMDPAALSYRWSGARVRLYTYDGDAAVALIFDGKADRFENRDGKIVLEAIVDERRFQVPVLTATYLGTGGIEGGADLKGRLKPLALGWPKVVEPVLIDVVNNVYQVSGYGPVQGTTALYERASSFGASIGDVGSYAALVSLTIPPGRWATCNASGLVRLGAPAAGVITCDVQGDNEGGALWRRTPGRIIDLLLSRAGLWPTFVNNVSTDALHAAVPRNISIYLDSQTTVLDLAREIAAQCNYVAGVSWTGKLFVSAAGLVSPAITAEVPALRRPVALKTVEKDTQGPFWRIEFQGERCWRVHRADEIAFYSEILDKGDFGPSETYREGNIVTSADGSRWIYVNPTPTSGNVPPTWPTASNAFWSNHTPPLGFSAIYDDGTKPDPNATRNVNRGAWVSLSNGTAFILGDEVLDAGSTWVCILAHSKSAGNGPPTLPTASNTYWRLVAAKGDDGSDGAPGADGAPGTDGSDGATGQSTAKAWQRAASKPATPADSAGTPAGWYDDPDDVPAGSGVIWSITGTRAAGAANYVWAGAVRDEAVTVVTGDLQKPMGLGTSAIMEFKLDAGASRTIEATWRATLAATNTLGIDMEWRVKDQSWTAFGADVPDSGGVSDVAYVTASGSIFNSDSVPLLIEVRVTGTRTNGGGGLTTDTAASFFAG
jgi:hypothetical protein